MSSDSYSYRKTAAATCRAHWPVWRRARHWAPILIGLSGNARTSRYRSLQESLAIQQPVPWLPYGYRSQFGGTFGWNVGTIGAFSAGLTRENYFSGDPGHIATLSWNKSWQNGLSLNVGMSHRTARLSPLDVLGVQPGDVLLPGSNYVYISLMVPLGAGVTSRTYAQRTDGIDRTGTSIDHRVNEFFGYRAAVEEVSGGTGSGRGANLSVYATPYYTTVGAGVSRVRHYDSTYAETSGGVLATGDGVAFSPYQVQDSFGTLRTGGVVGARIETIQGPVWSGPGGIAAIAALTPYLDSRMELGGSSVPVDIEVSNGLQVVQASRGAVLKLTMDMHRVQRMLLVVSGANDAPLPAGSIILRGDNDYFTVASEGGRVLITDLTPENVFQAELADGTRCMIQEITPIPRERGELFDKGTARCK